MEKSFSQKAFDDVEKMEPEKESQAWAESRKGGLADSLAFNLTVASMVGVKNFVKLIEAAKAAGVTDVLKQYAEYAMMKGFKDGYKAGALSMLEK